jgi:TetR/AcrR family transcriptional repressor of nem operon
MKVSRDQAAKNRDRVIETSARLFRERGLDGVGIADLMRSSGLTHGGFYGQFKSKDALAAESIAHIFGNSRERWRSIVDASPEDPMGAVVSSYLSDHHLKHPEAGCALATLAGDAARKGGAVAAAMTDGVEGLAAALSDALPPGGRQRALAAMAQMMGAVILARAVDDPGLAQEILNASSAALTAK